MEQPFGGAGRQVLTLSGHSTLLIRGTIRDTHSPGAVATTLSADNASDKTTNIRSVIQQSTQPTSPFFETQSNHCLKDVGVRCR